MVHRLRPVLKARAKVVVLTTVAKAKAAVHAMVHVLKVVQTVAVRTRTVAVKAAKSAAVAMVTSCHATSIL
jgi:hypothetical protein